MWAVRDEHGNLWLGEMPSEFARALWRIPEWLRSEDPRVRERLLPEAYDDPEEEAHWRRLGSPELERLFLSRGEIVKKDLASMRPMDTEDHWLLRVDLGHEKAWLAALGGARLALFALHGLEAEDMDQPPSSLDDEDKRSALQLIHMMAELQMVLMGE